MSLEKFLKGEPLNDAMKALMDDSDPEMQAAQPIETGVLDDDDREHLRRLLVEPGWRVLLKLLDSDIERREDAARRISLADPLSEQLKVVWADVAYSQQARKRIESIAQEEVRKLKNYAVLGR